jgi:hypothetical protein
MSYTPFFETTGPAVLMVVRIFSCDIDIGPIAYMMYLDNGVGRFHPNPPSLLTSCTKISLSGPISFNSCISLRTFIAPASSSGVPPRCASYATNSLCPGLYLTCTILDLKRGTLRRLVLPAFNNSRRNWLTSPDCIPCDHRASWLMSRHARLLAAPLPSSRRLSTPT